MPYISSKVNVEVSNEKELQLKTLLGKAISIIPGKTENWLMVSLEDKCHLYFGGSDAPAAYIEVKIFGDAQSSDFEKLTYEICSIFNTELGIAQNRIYVKYETCSVWGWNGTNF